MKTAEILFKPAGFKVSMWSFVFFTSLTVLLVASYGFDAEPSVQIEAIPSTDITNPITGLVVAPTSSSGCGNLACDQGETQDSCPSDCRTVTEITPFVYGDQAFVYVEFWDSRYKAGSNVQIDLEIQPEGVEWTSQNGCGMGGLDMDSSTWPERTISEDGHFRVNTVCQLPAEVGTGFHTLVANATITIGGSTLVL